MSTSTVSVVIEDCHWSIWKLADDLLILRISIKRILIKELRIKSVFVQCGFIISSRLKKWSIVIQCVRKIRHESRTIQIPSLVVCFCSMWVPYFLQAEEMSIVILRHESRKIQILSLIITVDKFRIHDYNPKMKHELGARLHIGKSSSKKVHQQKSAGKVM